MPSGIRPAALLILTQTAIRDEAHPARHFLDTLTTGLGNDERLRAFLEKLRVEHDAFRRGSDANTLFPVNRDVATTVERAQDAVVTPRTNGLFGLSDVPGLLVEQRRCRFPERRQGRGPFGSPDQNGPGVFAGAVDGRVKAGGARSLRAERFRSHIVAFREHQREFVTPGNAHGKRVLRFSEQPFGKESFLNVPYPLCGFAVHLEASRASSERTDSSVSITRARTDGFNLFELSAACARKNEAHSDSRAATRAMASAVSLPTQTTPWLRIKYACVSGLTARATRMASKPVPDGA
jgi:hypothetical protein